MRRALLAVLAVAAVLLATLARWPRGEGDTGALRGAGADGSGPVQGPGPALSPPPGVAAAERVRAPAWGARGDPGWSAPLAGTVVDAVTGQPVWHLELIVQVGGDRLSLVTDAAGRFCTRQALGAGKYGVRVRGTPVRATFAHGPGPYARDGHPRRPVEVGPTYFLEVESEGAPPDPGEGRALGGGAQVRVEVVLGRELAQLQEQHAARDDRARALWERMRPQRLNGKVVRLFSLGGGHEASEVRALIAHDSLGLWVRFPPVPEQVVADGPPWVIALHVERHGFADAEVHSVRGEHRAVRLRLQAPGSLEVAVRDTYRRVPRGATVVLEPVSLPPALQPPVTLPVKGAVTRARHLRPDDYRVLVRCEGFLGAKTTTPVIGGRTTELEFVLEPFVGSGVLAARIESSSGGYRGPAHVRLTAVDLEVDGHSLATRQAAVAWSEEGGAQVGRVRFDGLPPGLYELRPGGVPLHRFEPAAARMHADAGEVRFVLGEGRGEVDLYLVVLDGRNGAPLASYSTSVKVTRGPSQYSFARHVPQSTGEPDPGRPLLPALPPGTQIAWRVFADGFERAEGSLAEFGPEQELGGRRVRVARVLLAPAR